MIPSQPVASLPLSPAVRQRLGEAGFHTLRDLIGWDPLTLARDAGISHEDALLTLKVARLSKAENESRNARTALQMLDEERRRGPGIPTFCPEMDAMLGGGVKLGQLTEFCGVPGVGKTQLAMQLAVAVQLPGSFGGTAGECIYVDTEGSFTPERCQDIAAGARRHLEGAIVGREEAVAQQLRASLEGFTEHAILDRVRYYRIHDYAEQMALVAHLPQILESSPRVRLVVFDSITFHFRQGVVDAGQRARVLAQMAQTLASLADKHDVAMVLINQVTTRPGAQGAPSRLVPALGDSWGHIASSRVILFWQDGQAYAHLHKCPYMPQATVPYQVTPDGIRRRKGGRKRAAEGHQGSGADRAV